MTDSIDFPAPAAPGTTDLPETRLVIPWIWERQLIERYLERPDETMTLGRLGVGHGADGSVEWLLRELLPDRSALAGAPGSARFAAFTRTDGSGRMPWVESNLPALPSSVVVEIFFGAGAYHGMAWGFARTDDGRIRAMSEFVLPGPGMHRIALHANAQLLPRLDDERLSRTAGALGSDGAATLARLRSRPLAVFGASRNGLFIAEWAVRLGIPLILCDAKPLKRTHLGEISPLLGEEDVGHPKAEAFARRAGEWSLCTAPIESIGARADSPEGAAAAKRATLLVDACDTDAGRLAVAMLAMVYHRPQVSIATGVHFDAQGRRTLGADVRLVLPGNRCLLCLGGLTDYPRALRELAAGSPEDQNDSWRDERAGSLRSLNQAATAIGLRYIEDLFSGRVRNSRWLRMEWSEDGRLATREPEPGPRRADCPLCRKAGEGDAALGLG